MAILIDCLDSGPDEAQVARAKVLTDDLLLVVRQEHAKVNVLVQQQQMELHHAQQQYAAYSAMGVSLLQSLLSMYTSAYVLHTRDTHHHHPEEHLHHHRQEKPRLLLLTAVHRLLTVPSMPPVLPLPVTPRPTLLIGGLFWHTTDEFEFTWFHATQGGLRI